MRRRIEAVVREAEAVFAAGQPHLAEDTSGSLSDTAPRVLVSSRKHYVGKIFPLK